MAEKIKVRITATARVEYSQLCEISEAEFAAYEKIIEENQSVSPSRLDRILNDRFEYLIDFANIVDSDDLEELTIEKITPSAKEVA